MSKCLLSLFAFLTTSTASAGWVQHVDTDMPDFPPIDQDTCGLAIGFAIASSTGPFAVGSGQARDGTAFCEITCQNVAVGYTLESFLFEPDYPWQQGYVDAEASVSADGEVELVSGHVAATAIGYALVDSNIFSQVTAVLTQSAAESSASLLGTLSLKIEGVGASVPITIASGHGTFIDTDADGAVATACTNLFELKHKSRAQMYFYADESILHVGECNGQMMALGQVEFVLDDCLID